MLKKRLIVFIALFLLLSSVIAVSAFEVNVKAIEDRIKAGERAEFLINITNDRPSKESFRIFNPNFPTWDISTDPLINPILIEVPGNDFKEFTLFVTPLKVPAIGNYNVNIQVQLQRYDTKAILPLKITLLSATPELTGYIPTVLAKVELPDKIDPRESVPLKVRLSNQNLLEMPKLTLVVTSALIDETIETSLKGKEERIIEKTITLPADTKPQEDLVYVSVIFKNETIQKSEPKSIEIIAITDITQTIKPLGGILRDAKEVTFTNTGNSVYEGQVKFKTGFFASLFAGSDPKAKIVSDEDGRFFVWETTILPGGSFVATAVVNYLPLVVIILLLAAAGGGYYVLRSPIIIRKEASNVKKMEGGISEAKIILHIKNRGASPIKDVTLVDKLPSLAEFEKEGALGTLHPSKILKHEKKGTLIKWHIDELDAHEERVITYKIKSKLSIIGGFTLHPANAYFSVNGRKVKSPSNSLTIEG